MADTVKKSRIVSESDNDQNLEEALMEEFNLRLNSMSQDNQENDEEIEPDDQEIKTSIYENVETIITKPIISPAERNAIISNDFIQIERNFYEEPVEPKKNGHIEEEDFENNIYESVSSVKKIEEEIQPDQYVDMTSDYTQPQKPISLEYEDMDSGGTTEDNPKSDYETVESIPTRPVFTLHTTSFADDSQDSKAIDPKSVKDRMFLSTDDTSTLLFTQTVTSPMLTPSEENIDFLKGFRRESQNTISENTTSNGSPKSEQQIAIEKVARDDTEEICDEPTTTTDLDEMEPDLIDNSKSDDANEPIYANSISTNECDDKFKDETDKSDPIYENTVFLQHETENFYENVSDLKKNSQSNNENSIYENVEMIKKEIEQISKQTMYQNIEDAFQKVEQLIEEENLGSPIIVKNTTIEQRVVYENGVNTKESISHSENIATTELVDITEQVTVVNGRASEEIMEKCERESRVAKIAGNIFKPHENESESRDGNREKDTETVPPQIVQNLKNQFMKPNAEVVGVTKKEIDDVGELKTISILKQITKFEKKHETNNQDNQSTNQRSSCYNVNVKSLCRSFGDLTKIPYEDFHRKAKSSHKNALERPRAKSLSDVRLSSFSRPIENVFSGVSVKALKSSFDKFDALQKKNLLHVRSSDSTKAQEKFNGSQIDTSSCKSCGKVVFQMEQIKAEKAIWHKNCFRCQECKKQLTVDTYQSHEGTVYCKPHFKALFAPKVIEDEEFPSDKPDLGLEELQSLNVKERFQVFEHHQTETNESERTLAAVNVKRSPSILSKLAKFQAKGMNVGVSDEALNGIPIEESSSEGEEDAIPEGEDADLVRAKRVQREKPFHFTAMSDVKSKWEQGEQNSKDERREERKQELQNIRNRLFLGKQGKMKEAYQQAVMESESNISKREAEKIETSDSIRSVKERFERGEVLNEQEKKVLNGEEEVYESEISKQSRSLFLELDAHASKPPQMSPMTPPKLDVRKARESPSPDKEIPHDPDVVRADEIIEDSVIAKERHTATKMLNKFRQMEENLNREPMMQGPKPLKRFTPPPEPVRQESSGEETGSDDESDVCEEVVDTKLQDEELLEARKAARAKQLRAKFEKWEANEIKREQANGINIAEEIGEEQSQIESTKSLRARFESMRETTSNTETRSPRVKVNRFVFPNVEETCKRCNYRVYPLEKISIHGEIYHKSCFKCMECSAVLRMDSYSCVQGLLYCMPHYKRLFITKGNYDTAFGLEQHKEKWNATMA